MSSGATVDGDRLALVLETLRHRGPDAHGKADLALGNRSVTLIHTRLSIIDLSRAADQPMCSRDDRFVLIFNGEIYNHVELRTELVAAGYCFETNSDTEVLLYAWARWGLQCLDRLRGMFAFALLDKLEQRLYCVRDEFGVKPFFYSSSSNRFMFASEVATLQPLIGAKLRVNERSVAEYLLYGDYDYSSDTFLVGISSLPAGHMLELDLQSDLLSPRIYRWWNPCVEPEGQMSFAEAAGSVRELFLASLRRQLRSDVPLGFALSGGIDSSVIVCAARYIEPELDIHTFSYAADEPDLDEMGYADLVNMHVGAVSCRVSPSARTLSANLETLVSAQGEPFGSTSIYAQFAVFEMASSQGVKVMMDGQGADELFAGYNGFPQCRVRTFIDQRKLLSAAKFVNAASGWPGRTRRQILAQLALSYLSPRTRHVVSEIAHRRPSDRWLRRPEAAKLDSSSAWRVDIVHGRRLSAELKRQLTGPSELSGLLRHADRNSMHFSVEDRVPFLDRDLAEFVLRLPEEFLVSPSGQTKRVLRAAMQGIVPEAVLNRRDKIGFQTPDTSWVREMLSGNRSRLAAASGVLDLPRVNRDLEAWLQRGRGDDARWWRLVNLASWLAQLNDAGLVRV